MADSPALEEFRSDLKEVPTDVTRIKVDAKTIGESTSNTVHC